MTAESAYADHEQLVAPARVRPQLWRLLVGLIVVSAVAIASSTALHMLLSSVVPKDVLATLLTGQTPAGLLILLGGFGFVTFGVFVAARLVQSRNPLGVIGPIALTARQFWRVFRALLLVGAAVLLLPPYDFGDPLAPNLEFGVWVALLPFSLLAILIQTSAEEILFRGYIQQALAARFRSPIAWMVVPSALFALGHFVPAQAGENAFLIAAWAGAFGILMADLTARSGTLGPAIAVHMFNNMVAMLVVSMPDGLSGLSLYLLPYEMSDTGELRWWLAVDFVMMLICWLAARVAIRR